MDTNVAWLREPGIYLPSLGRSLELLATVVVHVWCHFLGLYLHLSVDRLTRAAFLSGRDAVEAEHAAEHQSNRLVSTYHLNAVNFGYKAEDSGGLIILYVPT
ncbi:hypothetical protein ANCDUO_10942 [Ancylostoma duodenale]|uniref:Uncharacterized protein n=1 Tax=Ancylostoma duodenale TaxID=51022 RepID=A0A0C2D9F0_9BILA|nr:hypothetical protein ANCDUO_10942 [Ancylostoma duodenale]